MSAIRIGVAGASGRMGRAIVRLAAADAAVSLVAAISAAGDPLLGRDSGELAGVGANRVPLTDRAAGPLDVLIDFSAPAGAVAAAKWCAANRAALVSGTTGLEPLHHAALNEAAESVPVLWAPNMSVGVNLLLKLVGDVAKLLGNEWDCEIIEAHHGRKADAPSGTAKALLDAVCAARKVAPRDVVRHGREGVIGPRRAGEIGMHAVRLGGVVGDHDVHFATSGEIITLRHHAESRDVFAAGALRAARWIASRPAGLYAMRDVLS